MGNPAAVGPITGEIQFPAALQCKISSRPTGELCGVALILRAELNLATGCQGVLGPSWARGEMDETGGRSATVD